MAFDPNILFGKHAKFSLYRSVEEELKAVANGAKAMSAFLFQDDTIVTDSFYAELRKLASELALKVVLRPKLSFGSDSGIAMTYLFILGSTNEAWRIDAYLWTKRIFEHYGWCDGAEHLEGGLLGYSDEECVQWLQAHKAIRAGWAGRTVYFLFKSQHMESVRGLGMRAIDPKVVIEPVTVFFDKASTALKGDAHKCIPSRYELARAALEAGLVKMLFGNDFISSKDSVVVATLTASTAAMLNSSLRSNFEVLSASGWC